MGLILGLEVGFEVGGFGVGITVGLVLGLEVGFEVGGFVVSVDVGFTDGATDGLVAAANLGFRAATKCRPTLDVSVVQLGLMIDEEGFT